MEFTKNELYKKVLKMKDSDILYSPSISRALGNAESAIILAAIIKYWLNNDKQEFYKFKEPCSHPECKTGESWVEYLGFSRKIFDTALKLLTSNKKNDKASISIVNTRKTIDRKTYYSINEERLNSFLAGDIEIDDKANLYLLFNPKTNLLKIGRSKDITHRIKAIRYILKNDSIILVDEIINEGVSEKIVHKKFSKYNVKGEWFQDVKEIREFFQLFK